MKEKAYGLKRKGTVSQALGRAVPGLTYPGMILRQACSGYKIIWQTENGALTLSKT